MTATDKDTSGSNAGPSRFCGLTSLVSAPATNPAGSSTMMRGNAQAAGQDLGSDGEREDQADPGQDLVGRHASLR